MAPVAAGLSVSARIPIVRDSVFSGKRSLFSLNLSTAWTRTSSKSHGVCAARGPVLVRSSRGIPANAFARDRVVDFGKNKGSMLGTLSSSYLRWMTKNLKGTMLHVWAEYAQEVLDDPLYMDRIEWEKVEKLLVQSHDLAQLAICRDALAPARMYGWDIDNHSAWSGVNFALLGTTKGGKIPRKLIVKEPKPKVQTKTQPKRKATLPRVSTVSEKWASAPVVEGGTLREELDRRRQARRERLMAERDALLTDRKVVMEPDRKFPGRGELLSKLKEKSRQQ